MSAHTRTQSPDRPVAIAEAELNHPHTATTLRTLKRLVGCYLGISVLTLVAIVLLRNHTADVNSAVWIRGGIVAATSVLMLTFATRAARGSRDAYLRLRIGSAVMTVAIAVIVSLPGLIPLWMKIEQGVCGLILIGVVIVANGKHLRSLFAAR